MVSYDTFLFREYILANMRDLIWFWFFPLGGRYRVAAGKVCVETRVLPQFGKPVVLMTDCCRKRPEKPIEEPKHEELDVDSDIIITFRC
jgi:hypothetical protein